MSLLCRYTFGKPVTGKLTVNMTVNGVGYYRHEMGHPVIKTMEVSLFNPYSTCFVNVLVRDFQADMETGLLIDCCFVFRVPSKCYCFMHTL